jgi:predicted transcriptional regulator
MSELGELEAAIMELLWSTPGPVSVRDLTTDLQAKRTIAYTTVLTVCDRLTHKGWLTREMSGRAWAYRPMEAREAYTGRVMRQALEAAPDREGALASFVGQMAPEQVDALRAAIREATADRP